MLALPVEVKVNVKGTALDESVTEFVDNKHCGGATVAEGESAGEIEQVIEALPESPETGLKTRLKFVGWPATMVMDVGEPAAGTTLKSTPVPLNCTLCGLPVALVLNESSPNRLPTAVGVNFISRLQFVPAARVVGGGPHV